MLRFLKIFHREQHGFTLVEILLMVAILGIFAGVLVPRLMHFMSTAHAVAANEEVQCVEKAVQAYWADNNGQWPPNDCNTDLLPDYLDKEAAHYNYKFDIDGLVVVPDDQVSAVDANVIWNEAEHLWEKN